MLFMRSKIPLSLGGIQIKVQFDESNDKKTFFAGQWMMVTIKVSLSQPLNTKWIIVRIFGFGETKFLVTERRRSDDVSEKSKSFGYYSGREEYFKWQERIFGSENGSLVTLPSGSHIFNVRCHLPNDLPPTFKHSFGFIKYIIKISIDLPFGSNKEITKSFIVRSPLDLNLYPSLRDPIHMVNTKAIGCCFCQAKPINILLKLPQSAFAINEPVPFIIQTDNRSNMTINEIKVQLIGKLVFHAQTPSEKIRITERRIEEKRFNGVRKFSQRAFTGKFNLAFDTNLIVLHHSRLIESIYLLLVTARIDQWPSSVEVECPIKLGSVAFMGIRRPSDEFVKLLRRASLEVSQMKKDRKTSESASENFRSTRISTVKNRAKSDTQLLFSKRQESEPLKKTEAKPKPSPAASTSKLLIGHSSESSKDTRGLKLS